MLSDSVKAFQSFLRKAERKANEEAKRQEAAKRHFDAECVRIQREEIRLVVDNGRSCIDWRNY